MGKRYKTIKQNGKEYKLCRGPLHPIDGAWIRVDQFPIRRDTKGMPRLKSWCKPCEYSFRNKSKNPAKISGFVPIRKYMPMVLELEQRIGTTEAARRVGIGKTTWYNWKAGKRTYMQRRTALAVVLTLREVRARKELRHEASIRRGSSQRGEAERPATLFTNPYTRRTFQNSRMIRS